MFFLALESSLGRIIMFLCLGYSTWFQCTTLNLPCLFVTGNLVMQKSKKPKHENPRGHKYNQIRKISPLMAALQICTWPCFRKQGDASLLTYGLFFNKRHGFASEASVPGNSPLTPFKTVHRPVNFPPSPLLPLSCFLTSALCRGEMYGESLSGPCHPL